MDLDDVNAVSPELPLQRFNHPFLQRGEEKLETLHKLQQILGSDVFAAQESHSRLDSERVFQQPAYSSCTILSVAGEHSLEKLTAKGEYARDVVGKKVDRMVAVPTFTD